MTECVVTYVSDTEINFQIGPLPVGSNEIYFDVKGKGTTFNSLSSNS